MTPNQKFVLTPLGESREPNESNVVPLAESDDIYFHNRVGHTGDIEGNKYVLHYKSEDEEIPSYWEEIRTGSADERAGFLNWLRSTGKRRTQDPVKQLDRALDLVCGNCGAMVGEVPPTVSLDPGYFPDRCEDCDSDL